MYYMHKKATSWSEVRRTIYVTVWCQQLCTVLVYDANHAFRMPLRFCCSLQIWMVR